MSLLGTLSLSHSSKLLKVPRIYNALITTDENLQPSQAYPALAPVIQGIQYPLPGYITTGLYRAAVIPNQVQFNDGRSFTYAVKEDFYHYNYVETGQPFKIDLPKIPEDKSPFDQQQMLFRPVIPQPLLKDRPPVSDSDSAVLYSTQNPSIFNPFDSNRKVYFESSPVQPGEDAPKELSAPMPTNAGRYGVTKLKNPQYAQSYPNRGEDHSDTAENSEPNEQPESSPNPEEQKPEPDFNDFGTLTNLVKNNRPKDPNIVDVPPPPLPIGSGKSDKKKPDEYPPPPGGYVL